MLLNDSTLLVTSAKTLLYDKNDDMIAACSSWKDSLLLASKNMCVVRHATSALQRRQRMAHENMIALAQSWASQYDPLHIEASVCFTELLGSVLACATRICLDVRRTWVEWRRWAWQGGRAWQGQKEASLDLQRYPASWSRLCRQFWQSGNGI